MLPSTSLCNNICNINSSYNIEVNIIVLYGVAAIQAAFSADAQPRCIEHSVQAVHTGQMELIDHPEHIVHLGQMEHP